MIGLLIAQADVVGSATPDLLPSLWRMLIALAVVLSLLGGLAWLMRRGLGKKRAATGFGIESALPLGDRRSLVVVTVEGRRLLLGLAPNHVSLVTELGASRPFDAAVSRALGREGTA
ncbi:MAG: flagellar biosynthetic protein FliO [Acidobacteria bacterium]|nr:flagellar biosynthetic protein FliO [Acidobacteriota bacterium]